MARQQKNMPPAMLLFIKKSYKKLYKHNYLLVDNDI